MRTLVAVFEIHMERSMVGTMKPSMIIRGEVPKRLSTDMAILLMDVGEIEKGQQLFI